MHVHHDMTSSTGHQGRWLLIRLLAVLAACFALVAASVSVAPAGATTVSGDGVTATVAATKCVAKIQKGKKLVDVTERYYAYAFKKVKGTKRYRKVIVRRTRKLKTSCTRQCVRTKKKKGKQVPVYKYVRKTITVRKGNKLVKAKRRVRVYTFQKCKVTSNSSTGTPVKVKLLQGSVAHLDFGGFKRDAPLTGELSGFIVGGYKLSADNQLQLTRGNINIEPTDVFIDDDCQGGQVSAAIRTGTPSRVGLDAARNSTSTILASGPVTATVYTKIQLPLALRNDDDGCNAPYITTGYSEFLKTFFFKGKIERGSGLSKLKLKTATEPLDVVACLSPGVPTSPCNGFQIPLPILVDVEVTVNIILGG